MNIKEQLIVQLNSKITELNSQIDKEENKKILELKEILTKLQDKITTILSMKKEGKTIPENLSLKKHEIASIETTNILDLFPNFPNNILKILERYIEKSRKNVLFFNPNKVVVLNNLKDILDELVEQIAKKEAKFAILTTEKEYFQEIINALENDYENIFKTYINQIIAFLKGQGKTEVEILKFIRDLATDIELNIFQNKDNEHQNITNIENNTEEEVEILEENQEDLETIKQKIIILLKDNGYSDIVSYFEETQKSKKVEKRKEDLFKLGNLENIEQIIKTLKKYNINLLEEMESNFYKILTLFLSSSKENIETIFKMALEPEICICKYDELGNLILDKYGNPQINFNLLLERVSRFITRKKRYKKRGNELIEFPSKESIEGNMGDYLKNIRFFQSLGVDIKALFNKFDLQNQAKKEKQKQEGKIKKINLSVGDYFDEPHQKILRNKNIFDFYQIPKESYLSALSCFVEKEPADTIDMFIELDLFDYLKNNMSRMNLKPNDPIFYRIVRTYQLANMLPNQKNLPLHENAKQFLFKEQQGKAIFDGYISNPERTIKQGGNLKLDTGIIIIKETNEVKKTKEKKNNGKEIVKQYTKEELVEKGILTEEQLYNFSCFDDLIKNKNTNNDTIELINEQSILIRFLNHRSNSKNELVSAFLLGREPNKIRISKLKFYRIYNTLINAGYNLENDRDCVLYALTYNSILTSEQFELIKNYVDNMLFKHIPQKGGRVGGRK